MGRSELPILEWPETDNDRVYVAPGRNASGIRQKHQRRWHLDPECRYLSQTALPRRQKYFTVKWQEALPCSVCAEVRNG